MRRMHAALTFPAVIVAGFVASVLGAPIGTPEVEAASKGALAWLCVAVTFLRRDVGELRGRVFGEPAPPPEEEHP
jgi:hypothetical protein